LLGSLILFVYCCVPLLLLWGGLSLLVTELMPSNAFSTQSPVHQTISIIHAPHPPYSLPRMDESLPEDDDTNTTPKLQCPRKLKALRLLDGWSSIMEATNHGHAWVGSFLSQSLVWPSPQLSYERE
jgi:hypothetical protein